MTIREFIQPEKSKTVIALTTALVYFNASLVSGFLTCITGETACILAWSPLAVLSFFLLELYYLLWGVLFYPFACAVIALYEARTDIRAMKNKTLVILGLVIFNPFVLVMLITKTAVRVVFG